MKSAPSRIEKAMCSWPQQMLRTRPAIGTLLQGLGDAQEELVIILVNMEPSSEEGRHT